MREERYAIIWVLPALLLVLCSRSTRWRMRSTAASTR